MSRGLEGLLAGYRMVVFYGRPGAHKKELVRQSLTAAYKGVEEIHYVDMRQYLKPDDLLGLDEDLLSKLRIYWLDEWQLKRMLAHLVSLRGPLKALIVVDPLYTQAGLSEVRRFGDPLFIYYALRHLCASLGARSWIFVDTAVERLEDIAFFSAIREDVDVAVHYYAAGGVIRLEAYPGLLDKGEVVELPRGFY